jgi:ppGpp synthetase/RelA/SpoT-type nucleotidyltranferase
MDIQEIRNTYLARHQSFVRAAKNVREAIELLIHNAAIPVLAVTSRVKDIDSFLEKCERKGYSDPFNKNTDFVGIRVITYLPRDVAKIIELIRKSLSVVESQDKTKGLAPDQFGYRSHHLIVKVPEPWIAAPNYEGLGEILIELQVRTILMHSWAEIEHKLQYKSKDQVPHELQRKLFMLSAKVEEADGQFESLVSEVEGYRKHLAAEATKAGVFNVSSELNLDSLKEYVAFRYPNASTHNQMAQDLYEEITEADLTFENIADIAERFRDFEERLKELVGDLTAPAILAYALEVLSPAYREQISGSKSRKRVVSELIELSKKNDSKN